MLPLDIILIILENTDDLETLKAWSLVCRSINHAAERLLWRAITISDRVLRTLSTDFDALISNSPINPAYVLYKEKCGDWPDPEHEHARRRPVRIRGPLVNHLVIENPYDYRDDESEHRPWRGDGYDKLRLILPPLKNLQTFELDGEILERTWTDLLKISSLRNLRIRRRTEMARYPASFLGSVIPDIRDRTFISFHGLSQLRQFEIGILLSEEGFALGTQVRKSNLETLHIYASTANIGGSPLGEFFRGLEDLSTPAGSTSNSMSGRHYGFPLSLRDLAIEDELCQFRTTSKTLISAFSACQNLTSLYLNAFDNTCLGHIQDSLYLPHLAALSLPVIGVDPDNAVFQPITLRVSRLASMIQRHRATLQKFALLNCWEEIEKCTPDLSHMLGNWLTIREIRLDASLLTNYDFEDTREPGDVYNWQRTASMLSSDGSRIWGWHFHRLRLDRVNLHRLNLVGAKCWLELKVLVLNPKLKWHFSIVAPEESEPWDVRATDRRRKHINGVKPGNDRKTAATTREQDIAVQIARMQSPSTLRLLSINQQRFWLQRGESGAPERLWRLSNALADPEQVREMKRHLTKPDWDFLAERTTGCTSSRGNTAVYMRSDYPASAG